MNKLSFNAVLLTAAVAAFAGQASAADLPATKAPPTELPAAVAAHNWTGCYLGAGGGLGAWTQDFTPTDSGGVPFTFPPATNGGRGAFGTVQGGCDYQFAGNWLIGAFADGDFGRIKGNAIFPPGLVVGEERETGAWSVGGRIGYLLTPQLLTYVSAGYTEARFGQINQPELTAFGPVGFVPAHTSKGWFIGGGTEYELGWLPGLFWKAEYRYADYGTDSLVDICTFTNQFFCHFAITPGQDVRTHIQTIRSGLVWRFDGGDSAGAAISQSPLPLKAPPAPAHVWTGCYVGAGGGYGIWSQDVTHSLNGVLFGLPATSGGSGGFGTVQGGCDYQFAGNWLAGAFADGDLGEIRGNLLAENFLGEEKEKAAWGAGARIGYLVLPQFLAFFSTGYTGAHFGQIDQSFTNLAFLGISTNIPSRTYNGWFIGAGSEYQLGWLPGLSWKTEYRIADYRTNDLTVTCSAIPPFGAGPCSALFAGISNSAHTYAQTIRSGFAWRF